MSRFLDRLHFRFQRWQSEVFWLRRKLKFALMAWRSIRGASIHGDTYTAVFVGVPKYRFNGKDYNLKFEVR